MDDFWDESDYFTGPSLTEEAIRSAEEALGFTFPDSYIRLIRIRNGGTPKRCCFPTSVRTSWAHDHVQIIGIRGIGGEWGVDSDSLGSRYMIREWGYPDVGVVVGETPSAGHDTVMLDYSLRPSRRTPHHSCGDRMRESRGPSSGAELRGLRARLGGLQSI